MSINSLREELKGLPGAEKLIMQYEDGGKVHVFSIDQKSVRLGPIATAEEIKNAFLKAFEE